MNNSKNIQKLFVVCGILSPILTFLVMTILGVIKPDYNPFLQTMSELGEEGGPNAYLASIFFIINGILLALFFIGLYQNMREYKRGKFVPIILIIYSIVEWIGSGVFPCDQNCAGQTFTGMMHMVISVIGLSIMCCTPLILWSYIQHKKEWQDISEFLLVFGILITIFAFIFTVMFFTNILVGLFQRILYIFILGWVFLLATKLYLNLPK